MLATPGPFTLASIGLTTAVSGSVVTVASDSTPYIELDGVEAATFFARLAYGSGGTDCTVYVQTTLDGTNWFDIACFAFTTSSASRLVNLSGLTPVSSLYTPTDGALSDNTVKDGLLGHRFRVKVTSTGTYANTSLSVIMNAR